MEIQTSELRSRIAWQRLILKLVSECSGTVTVEKSEMEISYRRRDLTESQYVSDTVIIMLSLEFA